MKDFISDEEFAQLSGGAPGGSLPSPPPSPSGSPPPAEPPEFLSDEEFARVQQAEARPGFNWSEFYKWTTPIGPIMEAFKSGERADAALGQLGQSVTGAGTGRFSGDVRELVDPSEVPASYGAPEMVADVLTAGGYSSAAKLRESESPTMRHAGEAAGAAMGKGAETATQFAVDPMAYIPMGAIARAGKSGHKLLQAASLVLGGAAGTKGAIDTGSAIRMLVDSGMSPEAAEKAVEGIMHLGLGALGVAGGKGLLKRQPKPTAPVAEAPTELADDAMRRLVDEAAAAVPEGAPTAAAKAIPKGDQVTLYHGEGGPEAGGAAGGWWTTNAKRAASYGGNVREVTVPRDVYEAGVLEARRQGSGTAGDAVLPETATRGAKAVDVKPDVFEIEAPAAREGFTKVRVPVSKLEEMFAKDATYYIPKGGEAIAGRRAPIEAARQAGKLIEPPVVHMQDSPQGPRAFFEDGRHRFAVLRDAGRETVEVMVPTDQAAAWKAVMPATTKLRALLRSAHAARKKLDVDISAERGARAAAGADIIAKGQGGGVATMRRLLSSMKGPIRSKHKHFGERIPDELRLTPEDTDQLINHIMQTPLGTYEKQRAMIAAQKLANLQTLQPAERKLVSELFGADIGELSKALPRLGVGKVVGAVLRGADIALAASGDFSGLLRQGKPLVLRQILSRHPIEGAKNVGSAIDAMFKAWGLPKPIAKALRVKMSGAEFYEKEFQRLLSEPAFKQARADGIDFTDIHGRLGTHEEVLGAKLFAKLPVVAGSNRAYTTILNRLRMDTYKQMSGYLTQHFSGEELAANRKAVAELINVASGRGKFGPAIERTTEALSYVMFAPRYAMSRVNMLNPSWYMNLRKRSPYAAKEALKIAMRTYAYGLTALGLAAAAGAKVESDPSSPDWGKARFGKTRLDPWAGWQQWARFFYQIYNPERKKLSGFTEPSTRMDVMSRFGAQKLRPFARIAYNWLRERSDTGVKPSSAPGEFTRESMGQVLPMVLHDLYEIKDELPPELGIPIALAAIGGEGVQVYDEPKEWTPEEQAKIEEIEGERKLGRQVRAKSKVGAEKVEEFDLDKMLRNVKRSTQRSQIESEIIDAIKAGDQKQAKRIALAAQRRGYNFNLRLLNRRYMKGGNNEG
jgi:hypothetical protein